MMKKIQILLLGAMLGFTACNDWLDVNPKTSIPTDKQFSSESGFKDALTGVYIKMGSATLYGADLSYGYIDELAGIYSGYPGYETSIVFDQSMVYDYDNKFKTKKNAIYADFYNVIANVNNIIAHTESKREVLVTPRYYETMRGEALALRAFLHFDLLRLFGPIYKEEPNAKAIAYRTTYDRVPTPILTAQAVVEAVLKDLHEAEDLLKSSDPLDFFTDPYDEGYKSKNGFLINREFRMNLFAVKAMLARVYCYKGDAESKALALKYAREVIDANQHFKLIDAQSAANYNSIRYSEQIFGLSVYELDKLLTANGMDAEGERSDMHYTTSESHFNEFFETAGVGVTDWRKLPEMFELTGASDVRAFCRKYNQKPLKEAYTYVGADAIPLIRLPEMYYIVAECEPDAQKSADALNAVRFARGISFADEVRTEHYDDAQPMAGVTRTQTKRINEIMKEYRKEFFAEGKLFFFLKAHNYETWLGCGVNSMTKTQYRMPLPDDEKIHGNNN